MEFGPLKVMRVSTWRRLRAAAAQAPALAPGRLVAIPRLAGEDRQFREPPAPPPSRRAMFEVLDDWVTRFEVEGEVVGGPVPLCEDPRLQWLLDEAGGVEGQRVLELGPLEGAHTRTLLARGAAEVLAIEGFRAAWLRCLVVKEAFALDRARFLYGDFVPFLRDYQGPRFDRVLASGVLYHQPDPVTLVRDLARVTDCLLVATHVADDQHPSPSVEVEVEGFRGRRVQVGAGRHQVRNYCGGVQPEATWLYLDELRRLLTAAGFDRLSEHPAASSEHGPMVLVVARRSGPGES